MFHRWALVLCGVVSGLVSTSAIGQGTEPGTAEALFREGKRLLEQKDFAHACPKLAESFRLDPATGALLATAICHENEGKIATAWTEYDEVAARSRREGRTDREQAARAKVADLERRLSHLTINVPADVAAIPDVRVQRSGQDVAAATWGLPAPVDPGTYVVTSSAPGCSPWKTTVTLGPDGDRQIVDVAAPPRLALAVEATPVARADSTAAAAAGIDLAAQPAPPRTSRFTRRQVAGLTLAGAGLVALGVGGGFALHALSKKHEYESQPTCVDTCQALRDANSAGRMATIFTVGGAALGAAGAVLYLLDTRRSGGGTVSVGPAATPGDVRLALRGTF